MTTAGQATSDQRFSASEEAPESLPPEAQTPLLLRVFCFLLPALPTYLVLPGALKGNGAPARMIALIMFGLVLLTFVMIRRSEPRQRINPGAAILVIYFALWLATYGVGLLNNDDFSTSTNRTRALVGLTAHVGVALYIIARVQTARQRDTLLGWLAAGLAYACLVGVVQGLTSIELQYVLQPPGFVVNRENIVFFERLGLKRVTGTSQHPIEFSVLAAVTIPLTLYLARNAATRRARRLAGLACALAVLAMPAAISRSGVTSLIAAMLVYMFAFRVRPILIALISGALAITAYTMAFPQIANALWSTITGSAEDASVESRLQDYTRVADLLRERPYFGLGLGGSVPAKFGYLDNEWMQSLVQGGLTGLTAMTIFSGGAIFGVAAALRRARSRREREQAYMLGAMAAGFLASSYTFDLFGFEQAAVLFFMVFGFLWSGFNLPVSPEPAKLSGDR